MKELLDRVRARLGGAVGVNEPPARLAAAWALGIGLGLSPLIGLHTAIALLLAVAFRLNKVDVLLGTLIANPWTLTVYFPAAVFLGRWITGVRIPRMELPPPSRMLQLALWRSNAHWVRCILIAWGVGATVCALVAGVGTYFVLRRAIEHHRLRLAAARERLGSDGADAGVPASPADP